MKAVNEIENQSKDDNDNQKSHNGWIGNIRALISQLREQRKVMRI